MKQSTEKASLQTGISDVQSFGQRLKAIRQSKGVTQEKLADLLDISVMTIRRWEWGARTPRVEEVKRIAEALHVSEQELLSDSPMASGWVLIVKIAHDFSEEVIDMSKPIPRKASITTTPEGGFLCLGGDYSLWTDDNSFKKFIADIRKLRGTVIQNGIALGALKA